MKTLITLVAAAAVALSASSALAKPGGGKGNGHGHGNKEWKQGGGDRDNGYRDHRYGDRENGYRNSRHGNRYTSGYSRYRNCPPGLAKKHNGCLPPGQASRMFRQGQRVPNGYNYYTDYSNIPIQYRNQYSLDPNSRYIYRNNQIYVVDPRTSLIQRIISSLL